VTGLPTPTGDGLTVGFLVPHAGSAPAGVGSGIVSAEVFGPNWATKASEGGDRLTPPVRGDTVLKSPEKVSPVTYVLSEESRAMLVPMSVADPPR
jgi:hypothetical protein